jgi:protein-S-isoprenylcysteine O-methyltransferase Ste14
MTHPAVLIAYSLFILTFGTFVCSMFLYFRAGLTRSTATVASATVLLIVGLHVYEVRIADEISLCRGVSCILLLAMANLLFWTAVIAHRPHRPAAFFSEAVPNALVTCGPYRFVRHPFYLSYLLAVAGSSFLVYRWFLFASGVYLFFLYNAAAASEKRRLLGNAPMAERYRQYLSRTWRWVPFLW